MTRARFATLALLVAAVAVLLLRLEAPGPPRLQPTPRAEAGAEEVARLFAGHRSGVWVGAEGEVERLLPDDREGSRHQRLIVRLDDGPTILVSHNIDLAPRVPAQVGDHLELYGRYEWNERGGLIHWTHRDPANRLEGGWIRHDGKLYR